MDGEGNEITYTYNCTANLTAVTDAPGYREQYVYDKEGNLAEKTDKNGVITEYAFNFYGAPLYRRERGSLQEDFYEYTSEGLLKSAISERMSCSYTYDAMGHLSKKSANGRTRLSLEYDGNGNRIRQRNVTEYRFDLLDQLTAVWDDGEKLAEYGYYPDGTIQKDSGQKWKKPGGWCSLSSGGQKLLQRKRRKKKSIISSQESCLLLMRNQPERIITMHLTRWGALPESKVLQSCTGEIYAGRYLPRG